MGYSALIFTLIFLTALNETNGQYDFFQLVLQYQDNVCSSVGVRPCVRTPQTKFSIHGLWPSNYTGIYVINCGGTPFNPLLISGQPQEKRLEIYWPDLYNASTSINFWGRQWNKHGICSEMIFPQTAYFDFALNIAEQVIKALQTNHIVATKKQTAYQVLQSLISAAIGATPEFKCRWKANPKNTLQLTEIVVCYNKQAPGTVQNCPAAAISGTCRSSFMF